jgi:hypothetical protein
MLDDRQFVQFLKTKVENHKHQIMKYQSDCGFSTFRPNLKPLGSCGTSSQSPSLSHHCTSSLLPQDSYLPRTSVHVEGSQSNGGCE